VTNEFAGEERRRGSACFLGPPGSRA